MRRRSQTCVPEPKPRCLLPLGHNHPPHRLRIAPVLRVDHISVMPARSPTRHTKVCFTRQEKEMARPPQGCACRNVVSCLMWMSLRGRVSVHCSRQQFLVFGKKMPFRTEGAGKLSSRGPMIVAGRNRKYVHLGTEIVDVRARERPA